MTQEINIQYSTYRRKKTERVAPAARQRAGYGVDKNRLGKTRVFALLSGKKRQQKNGFLLYMTSSRRLGPDVRHFPTVANLQMSIGISLRLVSNVTAELGGIFDCEHRMMLLDGAAGMSTALDVNSSGVGSV
jgi:hypothetical protein